MREDASIPPAPRLFSDLDPQEKRSDPPANRLVEGQPRATTRSFFESADQRVFVGTWTCEPGRWRVKYDETEYCRVLEGAGAVINGDGGRLDITAGDEFVIPAGFEGEWQVTARLTKRYVVVL